MIKAIRMNEFKNGVEELDEKHFEFIESEVGVTADEISEFTDDELDEKVYGPMCDIEIEEIPSDDSEESERCKIASEIVTILGNSLAEANGWI